MKKIFLVPLVFALFVQPVFSQMQLGVKGGVSFVNIKSISDAPIGGGAINFENKAKPSFHFGGFGIYEISEKVNIQGEFILTKVQKKKRAL